MICFFLYVFVSTQNTEFERRISDWSSDVCSSDLGGFIGRHSFFLEDILHDRAKQVVIVFSVLAVLGFISSFFISWLKPFKRELGCLVLSLALADRKSVVEGKGEALREDLGGHRNITKKKTQK